MRRAALAFALAGLLATAARAAEPEPLDEEFLEYLAEFAGQDEDWTWFAPDPDDDDEDEPKPVSKPQQQAAKPAPSQTAKQTEDRAQQVKP